MIKNGIPPNKIRINLLNDYNKHNKFNFIPTLTQIQSRSQVLRNQIPNNSDHTKVKSLLDLQNFIKTKLFSNITYTNNNLSPTQCIILNDFNYEVKQNDKTSMCTGFTFTCKKFLENIKKCIKSQPSGLRLAWGGTYKLMSNGWTLILFGSICTKFEKNGIIKHSFVPFSCTLTRSEAYQAFTSIIDSFFISLDLLKIPRETINVQTFSQDHCGAGANGVDYLNYMLHKNLGTNIILLDCETHVTRKIKQKKHLINGTNYICIYLFNYILKYMF